MMSRSPADGERATVRALARSRTAPRAAGRSSARRCHGNRASGSRSWTGSRSTPAADPRRATRTPARCGASRSSTSRPTSSGQGSTRGSPPAGDTASGPFGWWLPGSGVAVMGPEDRSRSARRDDARLERGVGRSVHDERVPAAHRDRRLERGRADLARLLPRFVRRTGQRAA